ncbi:hypothetical protein J2Y60_000326 [Arcicella sp. BE140]|nr:hypothetical protein [Arcicella sp. BE51]MDR6810145.1 hypothetical protein [Arcicella sp. BE140]MDR6821494.1 hypothetical protein [Arcicella sp. BE139]
MRFDHSFGTVLVYVVVVLSSSVKEYTNCFLHIALDEKIIKNIFFHLNSTYYSIVYSITTSNKFIISHGKVNTELRLDTANKKLLLKKTIQTVL